MSGDYDDGNIRVLEGLEAVRVRPGMYVGSTGSKGLHHLVYEVVDNSIEEALAGYCQNIDISINANGSITIADDGRGIPAGINPRTGKSSIEILLTVLCACGRGGSRDYKISGGLHGVGTAVVSALSSHVEVKVWQNQKIHTQRFEKGVAVSELEIVPSQEDRTGTMLTFLPDSEIFKNGIEFDFDTLASRFKELAYINPRLRINFTDRRLEKLGTTAPKIERYYSEGGLQDYIGDLNAKDRSLHPVIYAENRDARVPVAIAIQWCDRERECILGYANTVRTIDGGTHLDGLKMAVTSTINAIARDRQLIADGNLKTQYIFEGLTAIVSLLHPDPEWEGATRTKLVNTDVSEIVAALVCEALTAYLTAHPDCAEVIVKQSIQAAITDEIRKKEIALIRQQQS